MTTKSEVPSLQHWLSYSQISAFTCPYKWHLGWRQNIRRRIDARPLTLGSLVHHALAAYLQGKSWEVEFAAWVANYCAEHDLSGDEYAALQPITVDAMAIITRTMHYLERTLGWESVLVVNPETGRAEPIVEREFHCPLTPWAGYRGIVDWVARDPVTGYQWLVDWKVRRAFQDDEAEETNLQMASYQYLLMRNGIETVGTVQFQIRAATPKWPSLNKDGSMSRAKILTDWPTYSQALCEAGLDPVDYQEEMQPKLDYEWFRPVRGYRSPELVRRIWKEVIQRVAWDMARTRKQTYRNLSNLWCRGCWAREFCLADLRGEDTDYLIETTYQYVPSNTLIPQEEESEDNGQAE